MHRSADYGAPPADDVTADLSGQCFGNSYLLIEPIGGGATGTVWRALDQATGTQVAVKLLREELMTQPKAVTRFVQERAILLMLHHTNIVRVRDLLAVGGSLGLVMDLVPGGSLRDHLRRHGTLPPRVAAEIMAQIASALTEAHALDVVHRDLKPDNILLDRAPEDPAVAPRVRLTDFGIARVLDAAGLTTPEALIGTPNYLAPEVINGARPAPSVDVYAIGILLYELITGRPPYAGGPPVTVLRRHLECTPHRYDGIPDDAWRVIAACMDKDPARRPTAATLVTTMQSLSRRTEGVPALPLPPAPPFGTTSVPGQRRPSPSGSPRPGGPRKAPGDTSDRGRLRRMWILGLGVILACAAVVAGLGVPGWNLRDRDGVPSPARVAPDQRAPAATPSAPTVGPSPAPVAGGAPPPAGVPEVGPVTVAPGVPSLKVRARVFGPLECPSAYVWDPGHPARARPCHAIGPAIRVLGQMQALPGVQADVSLSLEDASTAKIVAGPFTCRGMLFTDFELEQSCGPFEINASRGRRYVVVQSWTYTGRDLLPGGTARSKPFAW